MEQCKEVEEEDKLIVKEMLKDTNKNFNNEDGHCTNQQLIGHKHMFRGVIVKDWVIDNSNSVNFHPRDKFLI